MQGFVNTNREICFNGSGPEGVVIVDVTDKRAPKRLSSATHPKVLGAHQGWLTEDHRYFFLDDELDEKLNVSLKRVHNRTRTLVFDVTDLDDPVLLTEFINTTTATDHNLYIRGRYMYQGNYRAGLRIIDVANPKNPREVGYLANVGLAWGSYPYLKNDVVPLSTDTGLFLARLLKR